MRLHTLLRLSAAGLASLGVLASVALYATAGALERNGQLLLDSVEGVRAAEALNVNLLSFSRARQMEDTDPVGAPAAAARAEAQAHRSLADLGPYISTREERELVERVERDVTRYLESSGEPQPVRNSRLHAALDRTRELVELNVNQAVAAHARNERVDQSGKLVAVVLAGVMVLGSLALLLWLRSFVFRPLVELRHSLAGYKSGARDRRLPVQGPEELRQIAAEFNELADNLTTRDNRQLEFLAGVAHDLRNPLNVLKLSADSISSAQTLPPAERIRTSLARISAQTDRLARLVDDLLDRTRVEAGNLQLHVEVSDLRPLVTEVADLHRASSDRHHLEVTLPPLPVLVRCDPTRVVQVLTNLVSNALKYSPGGGAVRIDLEAAGGEVLLTVADEGIGIAPGDLERIFEPFHRSSGPGGKIPGVGLGLSVARRLVQAHGGRIEVESQAGVGSTFRVWLPVEGPPEHREEPAARAPADEEGAPPDRPS